MHGVVRYYFRKPPNFEGLVISVNVQRSHVISVIVPLDHESTQRLSEPFFMEMLAYLGEEITRRGYAMLLQKMLGPMDDLLPGLIEARQAAGIVIVGQSTGHRAIETAASHYLPLVVWGDVHQQQSYCTVGTDNREGAREAVQHLIDTGRRRIAFFGDPSVPEIRQRYEGYKLALAQGPADMAGERVITSQLLANSAYEIMRSVIVAGVEFDAVFAASDVLAISAMRALIASGFNVPGDVSVVGFDDIVQASRCSPTLTTMAQDFSRGASTLIELLFRRLDGEATDSVAIPAELILRESSAR